jgi:ketosteroid isomerase-like protein
MSTTEDRLAALERRLQDAEDRLALLQIVAGYGPAVDSGSPEATADIWTADGVYDTFPVVLQGREALTAMVRGERHQGLIQHGAAHVLGMPHIRLDGDEAVVTNYSQLMVRNDDGESFRVWRTGVNRWHFVRTAEGWKATHRVNRQLDGTPEGRALLAAAVAPEASPVD